MLRQRNRVEPPVTEPKDALAAVSHANPYSFYRRLRETQPIYFDEALGLWIATSAEVITAILNEPGFYARPGGQIVPPTLQATEIGSIYGSLARMTDGEYQRQMKHAVVTGLSHTDRRQLQSLIDAGLRDLGIESNDLLSQGLHDAMYRLPAYVIAGLLGIEAAVLQQAADLTGYFVTAVSANATTAQIERGSAAAQMLLKMFEAQAERPKNRQSSVFRQLLTQALEAGFEPAQVTANAIGFLMQTFDATAGLIGNGLLTLQRFAAPVTIRDWPAFLAEVLRYDPPVQNTRRFATHYYEVGGQQILADQTVLLVLAAANRDPGLNPDPEAFRPNRLDRRLLTFGHGAHLCPGNLLAVTIASSALAKLWAKWHDSEAARRFAATVSYRPLPNVRIPEVAA
jgi:cytochrome P450